MFVFRADMKPDMAVTEHKAECNWNVYENYPLGKHVIDLTMSQTIRLSMYIYPAMTAFTDQYSLPNIFFDIGQL